MLLALPRWQPAARAPRSVHTEGLLLLEDHKQKPSAEDAGSFLTRERNSCARKERAPMNSDLNLRAACAPKGNRRQSEWWALLRIYHARTPPGCRCAIALAASLFTREIWIWLSGGLGTGVRSASLSDKGRVPLTSRFTWLESEPPRSRPCENRTQFNSARSS